jgi:cob(I)alamin adenosyltransferase
MSIVTKTGDNGETGLVGGGRVPKSDLRMHAVGTVDELNAVLGNVLAEDSLPPAMREDIVSLQHLLFRLGADIASPDNVKSAKRIDASHVKDMEEKIVALESKLSPLTAFILPGGSKTGSLLHLARTVCRRAERWTVALSEFEDVNKQALVFLNRLSDYLFLLARAVNRESGKGETAAEY